MLSTFHGFNEVSKTNPAPWTQAKCPQAPVCCQLAPTFVLPTFPVASLARPASPTHIRQQLPDRNRFDEKKSADVTCNSSTLTCLALRSRVWCFCSKFHQRTRNHVGVNHRRRRGRELRGAFHSVLGSWYDRLGKDPAGKAFHGYGKCTKWSICSRFAKFPC